jgi:hypothetical protein
MFTSARFFRFDSNAEQPYAVAGRRFRRHFEIHRQRVAAGVGSLSADRSARFCAAAKLVVSAQREHHKLKLRCGKVSR